MLCSLPYTDIITNSIYRNNIELRGLFMAKKIQKLTFAGKV